jgi:hypothetical protein
MKELKISNDFVATNVGLLYVCGLNSYTFLLTCLLNAADQTGLKSPDCCNFYIKEKQGTQMGRHAAGVPCHTSDSLFLKGLSHEIFGPVYWPVWMHLGLNKNRFWFLTFKEAPSI